VDGVRQADGVSTATVVLCPPVPRTSPTFDAAALADALLDHAQPGALRVLSPFVPDAEPGDDARTINAHWVAHLAIALATSGTVAPILLVVGGAGGGLAAALGFSQKASRRAVSGYVLVDADVPAADSPSGDWPDAPVHYVASPLADPLNVNLARLRGWAVHEIGSSEASTIAAAVLAIARD
jgi:hypothetical protein